MIAKVAALFAFVFGAEAFSDPGVPPAIQFSYDYTEDTEGMQGNGTLKTEANHFGKYVFHTAHPGLTSQFTLSCEVLNKGTHVPTIRAVYTDDTPEDYYGTIVVNSGCSVYIQSSHRTHSCCLPGSDVHSSSLSGSATSYTEMVATITV